MDKGLLQYVATVVSYLAHDYGISFDIQDGKNQLGAIARMQEGYENGELFQNCAKRVAEYLQYIVRPLVSAK